MAELTCPKCQSPMRSYERSGITVDQCSGCRGVFLDRGELERLVDAEGAYYEGRGGGGGGGMPATMPPEQPERREYEQRREYDERRQYDERRRYDDDDDDRPFGGGFGGLGGFGGKHGKRRKREGFLSELFD